MWNLFTHFFKCRHLIWLPVLCVTLAGCKDDFDDSELRKQIADLDGRLTSLEKLCAQMNTNISSMQTIVNALQQNDYITGVTPITEHHDRVHDHVRQKQTDHHLSRERRGKRRTGE